MKKHIFLIVVTVFNYVQSQNSKKGIIYYDFIDNHYNVSYNSYLVFNQNTSYFITAKDSLGLSNSKTNGNNEETLIEVDNFNEAKKTRKNGLYVYLDKKLDSIYFSDAFTLTTETIFSKEKRPKLNWKLINEEKKIGKFNCKKATVIFRGRNYICWYSQEIPLPYGPWKIQGLPGIILEVKTEDNFISFLFKKIKYPEENVDIPLNNKSIIPKNKKVYAFKDYLQQREKHIKMKENSLKILAKKFNVQVDPFSQKDNFIEIFEKK
ncbi:GLPGLI family protein [Polaribacter cellanae]|uniref:GLPGLI family protein n=1 Tax=Polaribacter cellanae TaxID=2818493 RepID=A0A975H5Y4_9FLAO|nr:GLPGLI family protein [Polaribacter cellanae]QTE21359.1 GLPGLI family protein [Polaribacter cellanae]